MLVSATGFEPVASNRYHPEGKAAGRFDVVLAASRPRRLAGDGGARVTFSPL